jgi:hypothetical protein
MTIWSFYPLMMTEVWFLAALIPPIFLIFTLRVAFTNADARQERLQYQRRQRNTKNGVLWTATVLDQALPSDTILSFLENF